MFSQLSSGARLGPYELLLPQPRTGAAEVWIARLARSSGFRSYLALKTIPRAYFDDVPTEHLLLEQAARAARIHHPNVVEMLDLGEQNDTLYLAMEWVDGESLQAVVSAAAHEGGVPLSIAVNLVGQLCRGLHAIHEQRDAAGVELAAVHGHISLQNLILAYNGTIKLSDFGIARAMDRLSFLTDANQRNHKLTFAAPEQLDSRPSDRRSDVFSAGTLLYLLMTSRHPFEGGSMRATLNNVCSNQPALPAGSQYPLALRNVLSKALRKAADQRWASALELGNALAEALPESFHSSSEQTLEAYLDRLCATHKLELHAQIRAAEVRCDESDESTPAGPASGPSSLRGVAMNSTADAVSVEPSASARAARFIEASPLRLALLSIFACCLALGLGLASRGHEALGAPPAASQMVTPEAGVEPLPEPRASAPSSASAAKAADSSELPRAPQPAPPVAPAPRASLPPRPSPRGVASTSSSAARPVQSAAPIKVDAWDTSTFGGRY